MISNTALVAIATGGMLFASCGDHDMFNPNYKAEEYALNWEQKIGAVDPNQDWSMATKVTAKANVPNADGSSIMRIYSSKPSDKNCRLLAKTTLVDGKGDIVFDAAKGVDQVYATISGTNLKGWFNIEGATVSIDNASVVKKAQKTRGIDGCSVTFGTKHDLGKYADDIKHEAVKGWDGKTYRINDVFYRYENGHYYMNTDKNVDGEYEDVTSYIGNYKKFPGQWAIENGGAFYSQWKYETIITPEYTEEFKNGPLYELNGIIRETADPWILQKHYNLFGPDGFFSEYHAYLCAKKTAISGYNIDKLEQDVKMTTEKDGAEVEIPFVYGATNIDNVFGYFYYTDEKDRLTAPRYILMNAEPNQNITWENGTAVGEMELGNIWAGKGQPNTDYDKYENNKVYGSAYKLVYFGADGLDETNATYKFPKGVHIEFFICDKNKINSGNMLYSSADLNKTLTKKTYNVTKNDGVCTEYNGQTKDESRGSVRAVSFAYDDKIYVGFEDGVDYDMNDLIFWVEGDVKSDVPPIVIPDPDKEEDIETIENNSWILACEDLGSTDDYDFNDIVLEVTKKDKYVNNVYQNSKLVVKCLAAGGTLPATIYYDNNMIGEAHAMLGESNTGKMINTTTITNTPIEYVVDESIDQNWTLSENKDKFKIVVNSNDNMAALIEAPADGEAPQMIIVPGDWQWPTERAHIEEAYPDFKSWNSNASLTDWNNAKVADKVIERK